MSRLIFSCQTCSGLCALAVILVLVAGPAGAVCVEDARGRSVCLDSRAERVISLSPGATELLFSAGAGGKVRAVSAWSNYPPESANLPQVGDSNRLDLEAIVTLNPDLVVAWTDGNSRVQLARIEELGIPVFWLRPRTFEDIARAVENLALLTGDEGIGSVRASEFLAGIAELRAHYGDSAMVRVFYQIWDQPLMTINREELIGKAIELCGGVNVFGELPRLVPRISTESVLEVNPEVIVTSGRGEKDRAWLEHWEQFPGLKAVRLGNLFLEPPDLLARPTLRMLEGARHLCETLEQARVQL